MEAEAAAVRKFHAIEIAREELYFSPPADTRRIRLILERAAHMAGIAFGSETAQFITEAERILFPNTEERNA